MVPELVEGNGNYGQRRHHYYEQNIYKHLFKEIWDKLRGRNIVRKSLADIENSQVFKYSPFKSLTEDQHSSILEILEGLTQRESNRIFVEGGAGTGKTILATFLVKLLRSDVGFDRLSHQILRSLRLRSELSRTPVVRSAPELVEGWPLSSSKGGYEIITADTEKCFQGDSRPGGLHGDKTFRYLQKRKIRSVDRGRGPSAAPVPEYQLGGNVP